MYFNSSPNSKILDWSKFKAYADHTIKVTQKLKFVLEVVENIMGKGENTGYQHFLLFPEYFQNISFSGLLIKKSGLCGIELKKRFHFIEMFDYLHSDAFNLD